MAYANSRGRRIHYREFGTGAPLVLQHGFSGSLKRWIRGGYVDELAREFRVIAIDALGHGESDKPHDPAAYRVEGQADDIVSVLDALGIDVASYWGYSMGGRIGFALAKVAPERFRALVIGGAHPYSRVLPPTDRPDGSDPAAFIAALYKRTGIDIDILPKETREELFANDFRALAAVQQDWPSLEAVLPTIAVPTLLYVGGDDVYAAKMQQCAALIPGATLITLPGLDHGSAFWATDQILPQAIGFLRGAA